MRVSIKEIVIESDDPIDGVVIKFVNKGGNNSVGCSPKIIPVSTAPAPAPTTTPYDITINTPTTTSQVSLDSGAVSTSVPQSGSFGDIY